MPGLNAILSVGTIWLSGICARPDEMVVAPPVEFTQGSATIARPETAGRLVKKFDFEERLTNPGEVPKNWYRAQEDPMKGDRPGFPPWNKAALGFTTEGGIAASGEGAVHLPTHGGNTSLLLGPGVIPIFRSADYGITAKVRTKGLQHAAAGVVARFIDAEGKPIPASECRTEFVRSEGDWRSLHVDAVGKYPDAAFLQLELLVEQPRERGAEESAISPKFQVVPQDLNGEAWFDDVLVTQLPRVELSTQSPVNVLVASQKPELRWVVRDLAGERLSVDVRVIDADGHEVAHDSRDLAGGRNEESWTPALRGLGWYRATMVVNGRSGEVGGSTLDFVWVPDRPDIAEGAMLTSAKRERLGLVVGTLYPELAPHLRSVCTGLGVGAITLPGWSAELTADGMPEHASKMSALLRTLGGLRPTIALDELPEALSRNSRRPAKDVWGEFQMPMKDWFAFASPLLEALGQQAARWQIGTEATTIVWNADRDTMLASTGTALSQLVPAPTLAVPVPMESTWLAPSAGPRSGGVALVASIAGGGGGVGLSDWTVSETVGAWARQASAAAVDRGHSSLPSSLDVILGAPAMSEVGAARQAATVSRALVEAWAAASESDVTKPITFACKEPWTWAGLRRPILTPTPAFAAWRATADRLVGRHCVGELDVGEGVRALLFSTESRAEATRHGMIAVWVQSPHSESAVLQAYLGEGPFTVYDHFGNVSELTSERDEIGSEVARVPLTDRPIFIEGVNLPLVKLLASIRIEPPLLETNNRQGEHFVVFDNPFPTGVNGRISVLEPGGFLSGKPDRSWRISPRELRISANADSAGRAPMTIAFSSTQEAGKRDFVFRVELLADRSYGPILVRRPVAIGLNGLGVELTIAERRAADGSVDVVVEAAIANTGLKNLTLDLTAFAPDEPRRKSAVTNLPPGQQTVRRFVYTSAAERLSQREVLVSVTDADTGARLNRTITVP